MTDSHARRVIRGGRVLPPRLARPAWRWLLACLCLLVSQVALAAETLRLSTLSEGMYLTPLMSELEDPDQRWTLEDLLRNPDNAGFRPVRVNTPNHGVTTSTFWYRGALQNDTGKEGRWYLEVDNFVSHLTLHILHADGRREVQYGGSRQIKTHLPEPSRSPLFIVDLKAGERASLMLEVSANMTVIVPLQVWTSSGYLDAVRIENLWYGAYYGIMLAMAIYNAFIALSIRDRGYAYCTGLILSAAFNHLFYNQFSSQFASGMVGTASEELYLLSFSVFGLFLTLFSSQFLNLAGLGKTWVRAAVIATGLCILGGLTALFSLPRASVVLISISGSIIDVLFLAAALVRIRQGDASARFYLAAWSVFLVGVLLFGAMANGLAPYNAVTAHALQFGSAIGAIVFSMALAARMRQLMSDRNSAQQQMIQSERMASLGMLSAGVAHDINNPNNFARVSAQNLRDRVAEMRRFINEIVDGEDGESAEVRHQFEQRLQKMEEQLGLIDEGTTRIADIVSGMRATSRSDSGEKQWIDPVQGLENSLRLVMTNFRTRVEAVTDFRERPLIEGRMSQLNQVYMNVLMNACQAIEEKQTALPHAGKGLLTLRAASNGRDLMITITDDGCGMSEQTQKSLFKPFFTTKGGDKGTGLGMSICQTIMEEHGGSIEVASSLGVGTTLRLIFPLPANATPPVKAPT
jgi:two-component system NtrC family sensor kinase